MSKKASKKPTLNTPPQLGDDEIVRLKNGPKFFGVGKSTLAAMVKKGQVPKPTHFSERCAGWTMRQIREWQQRIMSE
jgi:predicted DNA-binding transcriptional regulator AlpA